jgi:hypothetical protein
LHPCHSWWEHPTIPFSILDFNHELHYKFTLVDEQLIPSVRLILGLDGILSGVDHMKAHKFNITLFILLLLGLGSMNLLIENSSAAMAYENRILQQRPTFTLEKLLSGELFRQYDQYMADHFVFREGFVSLAAQMEALKGLPWEEQVQIVSHQGANTAQRVPSSETVEAENHVLDSLKETPDHVDETLVNDQVFGRILIYSDRAMEIHSHNEDAVTAYAQMINLFNEQMPHQQVYVMQVPTAIQFLEQSRYGELSDDQFATIASLERQLHQEIISIDVAANLELHQEEDLYFRTDHHWTARGAYYAYSAFMEQTGRKSLPLVDYEEYEIPGFLGSLYGATRSESLAKSPDTIEVFLPPVSADYQIHLQNAANQIIPGQIIDLSLATGNQPFSVFLGGDQPLAVITNSQAASDSTILVVKDSYANPLIPFLSQHYREVHVIDPRMYTGRLADYAVTHTIDEVLFLNYVLVHRYEGYAELLEELK